MEAEKKRSKGGGFLNLFDWNGKSRKKLFASNVEDLPGPQELKQEKTDSDNLSKPGNFTVDVDDNELSSSNIESGDCNSASCVTSDDGNGTIRAPSVVARLMGLDSLPTISNVAEPSFGSSTLSDLATLRSSRSDFYPNEYVNIPNRLETISRNHIELKSQRHHHQSVPIDRFQTEVLPPKSAKSIPITHHKLLSPIKNPGFVSTKNVTYIMEAAAKIIEASPRSLAKSKVSSIVTSSVPMRIRDLKEKMEAANKAARPEKPKEVSASKYSRGQHSSNKSLNGSEYVLVTRGSTDSEKQNVNNPRDKGRSVSTSLRARTANKSFGNRKEPKSSLLKCQPNVQRSEQKRTSPESSNNVLRQNNQKQNCVSNKDKSGGKHSVSNNPARRTTRLANGSIEPSKTIGKLSVNSRTGLRKTGSVATSTEKDVSSSVAKTVAQMKKHVSSEEAKKGLIKCNVTMDSRFSMSPESRKPGMDVISFTFNSPLKSSRSPRESLEKKFGDTDQQHYSNGFALSSSPGGLNVVGVDSLSALLEQKLLELTNKVQSYESKRVREESSVSCASASEDSKQVQICVLRDKDKADSTYSHDSPSVDGPLLSLNNKPWQDREERGGTSNNIGEELEDYDDLSVESSFELSFESESFASGSKGCLFSEAQSGGSVSCGSRFLLEHSATKSSESTPSSSARSVNRRFGLEDDLDNRPSNWELEYVRNVLNNAELAVEDFALGEVDEIITRNLFDHLENEEEERSGEECSKLGRKALFDCVNECLELRCEQMYLGTCSRLARLSPRKEWLAEELYEEISGWKSMTDWMLDELVDKEMSTRSGRWLDFDKEAFEEGVEIEKAILSSLVDELVFDLVVF